PRQTRGPALPRPAQPGPGPPGPVRAAHRLPAPGRHLVAGLPARGGRHAGARPSRAARRHRGPAVLGGFVFESVGDWQLARFKADPAHQGLIMDRGLWRYTRHPNYFGDFCMWWGLFLIALGSWAEVPAIIAPLLMTFILTRGTGQRLTDH